MKEQASPLLRRYQQVQARLDACASAANLPAPLLLAVSKTRPAHEIRELAEAGARHFGENYLQEALEKIESLQDCNLCWHFIGAIQSNKTRPIAEHFHWVHTVDRLKIARRLSEQRPDHLPPLNVCIQVNIDEEDSKAGLLLPDVPALAAEIATLPGLRLRGLMAIPAPRPDGDPPAAFARLAKTLASLQATIDGLDTLSMGMSADMEDAIRAGSTLVRIGTDIFGPRSPQPATANS